MHPPVLRVTPRSLSAKLAALTTLGVAAVLVPYGLLRLQREASLFDADMRRDHATIAHALRVAAESVASRSGAAAVADLLADADLESDRASIEWHPGGGSPAEVGDGIRSTEVRDATGLASLETRIAVRLGGDTAGEVRIREPLGERQAYLQETVQRSLWVTALLIALCFGVNSAAGWWLLRRPMRALLDKVARVGAGDLTGPLPATGGDELGTLASALNDMCDQLAELQAQSARATEARVAAVQQLRHANRLSTVGTLASGIAHELGTPLNVISARGTMLARGQLQGDAAQAAAQVIVEQAYRMGGIIRQLLDFVRRRPPQRHGEDVHALCERSLQLLEQLASKRNVVLELAPSTAPLPASVDGGQIQQVITNLVVNAIQAQPDGGTVRVTVANAGGDATDGPGGGPAICIRVSDDGVGMTGEVRERLFEPFFTTKEVGEGTGLGLSVAYGIVAEHGGRIEVDSAAGEGSQFTVHLPVGPA